jgi:hypothetical protein
MDLHKNKEEMEFYNKIFCTNEEQLNKIATNLEIFLKILFESILSKYSNIIDLLNNNKTNIYEMWYTAKYFKL